jgi:hypothetical protein
MSSIQVVLMVGARKRMQRLGPEFLDQKKFSGCFSQSSNCHDRKGWKRGTEGNQVRSFIGHHPVVIFSTSEEKEEINSCYSAGANSYVVKPVIFDELLILIKHLEKYWSEIVKRSAEEACG